MIIPKFDTDGVMGRLDVVMIERLYEDDAHEGFSGHDIYDRE